MMGDLLVAILAGAGVIASAAAFWVARRRGEATRTLARLGAAEFRGAAPVPKQRKALLAGFAARFEKTAPGARLAAYTSRAHPHVPFSDVVALTGASIIGGALAGILLFGGGPLVLVSAVAGPVVLDRLMIRLGGRRIAKLEQQLPEALALQASALRAGHSIARSLRMMAQEIPPPLSDDLEATVREIEIGRSIEQVLAQLASRIGSKDVDLWVTAMLVHRMAGGDLATLLDGLASRVRERSNMRAELRALTAQGRLSGLVVGAAPLAFFILLSATSRDQMRVLYSTPAGLLILIAGLALMGAGFLWIRWILRVRA